MNNLSKEKTPNQNIENIKKEDFDFESWVKAVRPQLLSALRGNFTLTQVTKETPKSEE